MLMVITCCLHVELHVDRLISLMIWLIDLNEFKCVVFRWPYISSTKCCSCLWLPRWSPSHRSSRVAKLSGWRGNVWRRWQVGPGAEKRQALVLTCWRDGRRDGRERSSDINFLCFKIYESLGKNINLCKLPIMTCYWRIDLGHSKLETLNIIEHLGSRYDLSRAMTGVRTLEKLQKLLFFFFFVEGKEDWWHLNGKVSKLDRFIKAFLAGAFCGYF